MSLATSTIDITDTVEKMRSAFVDWAVAFIYAEELAIPGLGPIIALPIIGDIDRLIIRMIVESLSKHVVMEAFFMNTAIRKAAQAGDFVDAANALGSAPKDISDDEYKKLEQARADAFRNFVMVTN